MKKRCQFIEECFAANIHCDEYLEKTCYQAELMKIKLKQAKDLPCPLCPNLKCDIPSLRALLKNPQDCVFDGKCLIRKKFPETPAEKFEDFQRPSKKIKLSGMEIIKELNRLSI